MEEKPLWLPNEQMVASLIYRSIEGAAALYTIKGNKLFEFFENIFKQIR